MGCCSCLWWVIKWTVIVGLLVLVIHFWLHHKDYLVKSQDIVTISLKYKDSSPKIAFENIHAALQKKYSGHILAKGDLQWIFINAGGWMGSMCLVHASLTEYILFFGTPVETMGHSGRYWANITDTLISGEFHQWLEGSLDARIFKPGDTITHVWGEATAVNFKANTWMVEYGRGFIPSTLGFALADTLFSTQDFITLFYTMRVYSKALLLEFNILLGSAVDKIASHI